MNPTRKERKTLGNTFKIFHPRNGVSCRSFNVPGRNDLCPCGSGKKYKKCHLISRKPLGKCPRCMEIIWLENTTICPRCSTLLKTEGDLFGEQLNKEQVAK